MSDIKVYISDDYYKAYLSISFTDDDSVEVEDVINVMVERNVTFGNDMEVITALCTLKEDIIDELIAEGQHHIHGVNAEIILTYDSIDHGHPKLLEDGTVDFKNLGLLQKVSKGETLATKIVATEGIDGMTVTGKVIRARNGKDLKFSVGENVEISEDGLAVLASCDGIYKNENGKLSILNFLEFNDGVGLNTGNIEFKGDIFINGNVINGFTINCDGNLSVNGIVEGAFLDVTGDIIISKGISGHSVSVINCGGDLVTKYMDNAEISVKGNLEAGEIINCKVMCDGEVTVKGKKGHIVGGEITARYAINATSIGSKLGVITIINLGVDIESIKELKALKTFIVNEVEKERQLKQIISILHAKEVKGIITDEEKAMVIQCNESKEQTHYLIKEKTARLADLRELFKKVKSGQIKTEAIYPDTLVKIGQSSYFIDEAVLRSIIKKSRDEIVAIGF